MIGFSLTIQQDKRLTSWRVLKHLLKSNIRGVQLATNRNYFRGLRQQSPTYFGCAGPEPAKVCSVYLFHQIYSLFN